MISTLRNYVICCIFVISLPANSADGILNGVSMGEVNFNQDFNTAIDFAKKMSEESGKNVQIEKSSIHPKMAPNYANIWIIKDLKQTDEWEIFSDDNAITMLSRMERYPDFKDYTKYPSIESTKKLLISKLGEPTLSEEIPETMGQPQGVLSWYQNSEGKLLKEGEQEWLCPAYEELFKKNPNIHFFEDYDLSNCGAIVIFEYLLVGGDNRFFYNYRYIAYDVKSQYKYIIAALKQRDEIRTKESTEGKTPSM